MRLFFVSAEHRGFAHRECNFLYTESKMIPIFCNGLTRFGGKLIMSATGKFGHKKVSVIPLSVDSYISMMIGNCRYLDSQRFLNADLKSAASESGSHCFKYLGEFIRAEDLQMFTKTVPLCTEYLDEPARLLERELPPKSAFFNAIEELDISDADYEVAANIWDAMEMHTLRDYLETCLLANVLLLTDVLVIFRRIMTENFKLDPFQYFSLSGFSLDVALRESETKLELLTDIDIHTMIESSLRGALAIVGSPRYAKANNIEMPRQLYEPDQPKSHILFLDVNSMYAHVMKKYRLPTFKFEFLTEYEIERFDLMSLEPDSDKGYRLECQLEYPEDIHDATDAFGFAPEHIRVNPDDLSDYTRDLAEECGISLERLRDTRKLCLTLTDKDHYVGHYLNVKYYVSKGMILKKIYKIIRFTQNPWLEDLMEKLSTKERRRRASSMAKSSNLFPTPYTVCRFL